MYSLWMYQLCFPWLSFFLLARSAAIHRVVLGGFLFVAFPWAGARVTCVCLGYVVSMAPTVVAVCWKPAFIGFFWWARVGKGRELGSKFCEFGFLCCY
jgi:hypothetical protein